MFVILFSVFVINICNNAKSLFLMLPLCDYEVFMIFCKHNTADDSNSQFTIRRKKNYMQHTA